MIDLGAELIKMMGKIVGQYGLLIIPFILIVFVSVWITAHHAASPGEKVEIVWGLVKYTKRPLNDLDSKEKYQETNTETSEAHTIPYENDEISITIVRPRNNSLVPQFTSVEYSLEGQLPNGYHPILVVRDPLGQYWSWGSSSSNRHVNVQIGIARDQGKDFEIGVLVTNEDFPLNEPRKSLPQNIYYHSILVTRQ